MSVSEPNKFPRIHSIIPTSTDGNCLFDALRHFDHNINARAMRTDIVDYMRKHQLDLFPNGLTFMEMLASDEEVLEQADSLNVKNEPNVEKQEVYLNIMDKEGVYGGFPEIIAASRILNSSIYVFSGKTDSTIELLFNVNPIKWSIDLPQTICLTLNDKHYEVVLFGQHNTNHPIIDQVRLDETKSIPRDSGRNFSDQRKVPRTKKVKNRSGFGYTDSILLPDLRTLDEDDDDMDESNSESKSKRTTNARIKRDDKVHSKRRVKAKQFDQSSKEELIQGFYTNLIEMFAFVEEGRIETKDIFRVMDAHYTKQNNDY
jgi:hypothetical protein